MSYKNSSSNNGQFVHWTALEQIQSKIPDVYRMDVDFSASTVVICEPFSLGLLYLQLQT